MTSHEKGQTGIEAILIAALIISAIAVIGATFFSNSSDITTAVIILKTDLLKEMAGLSQSYDINGYEAGHSLEPVIAADGSACFEVRTSPALTNADRAQLESAINPATIIKINNKTRFKTATINIEANCP